MQKLPNLLSKEQAEAFVDNLSMAASRDLLVELLVERQGEQKILITQEQLHRYFKVRGLKATEDGFVEENRGKFSVGRGGRKD